jgi:NAD(P)-dependent dehydrogenase (short-subunit alcohol dehydrogenase family)
MSPSSLLASTIDTDGVAVVTGGASGFGLETATRLLRAGMSVVILDVSVEELEAANQKLSTLAPDGVGVLAQRWCATDGLTPTSQFHMSS